ncbi:MAG: caspase family protein [Magnetospirillum sp.]|nr:MAG: caspase family protein [Magnetospirillum sp.]
MRRLLLAMALAAGLAGCTEGWDAPPPQVAIAQLPPGPAALRALRVGVVANDSYARSVAQIQAWEDRAHAGMAFAGPSVNRFNQRIYDTLNSRFNTVVKLADPAKAAEQGVDLVMTLDTRVQLGQATFSTSAVTISGTFADRSGRVVDTVAGSQQAMVTLMNFTNRFNECLDEALKQFAQRLDDSRALLALAESHPSVPPAAATAQAVPPRAVTAAAAPGPRFAEAPVEARFRRVPPRPDDIAVVIGNADYSRAGKDIADVRPAHADARGMRRYVVEGLGVRDGNVIYLEDATGAQMMRVFGSREHRRGQLADWVKPGRSRVVVYYSGHGAPGREGGSPYLVPVDADGARIEINGYPLSLLYENLAALDAESVTVVLEACFSGMAQGGSVMTRASPVYFEVKAPPVPARLTVIAAGAANQVASWEQDGSAGLFTKYFLKAMSGEADADRDGKVGFDELDRYLKETLTYYARRYYGRDQQAQIVAGGRP